MSRVTYCSFIDKNDKVDTKKFEKKIPEAESDAGKCKIVPCGSEVSTSNIYQNSRLENLLKASNGVINAFKDAEFEEENKAPILEDVADILAYEGMTPGYLKQFMNCDGRRYKKMKNKEGEIPKILDIFLTNEEKLKKAYGATSKVRRLYKHRGNVRATACRLNRNGEECTNSRSDKEAFERLKEMEDSEGKPYDINKAEEFELSRLVGDKTAEHLANFKF